MKIGDNEDIHSLTTAEISQINKSLLTTKLGIGSDLLAIESMQERSMKLFCNASWIVSNVLSREPVSGWYLATILQLSFVVIQREI